MTDPAEWWSPDVEEGERHKLVFEYVRALEDAQWEERERDLRHGWLYDQTCRLMGVDFELRQYQFANPAPVTENVVRSVIDTATSMIARNRPRISIVTDGGNFKMQRKARQLERFLEAEFRRMGVYPEGVRMFRSGAIFGTGALHVFERNNRPAIEHVAIDELIVDEEECRNAPPRQIHRRKFVDKSVLKSDYPEFATEIELSSIQRDWCAFRRLKPRQVAVVESWRLPSSPGAGDGWHSISVENASLVDEEYKDDYFPFVIHRWSERINGFHGSGIAELLVGVQLRINRHNRFIATAQDRIAIPRVYVQVADGAIKVKLTNAVGQIIPYRGRKPEFETPVAVSPEIYANKRELRSNAYQDVGISELSASSVKPVGLESAPALREYNDIETQRFAIQAQSYEECYPEIGRQTIRIAARIAKRTGQYRTVWNSRDLRRQIDWNDVDLDEDEFSMALETASILSRSPAGRKQEVIELSEAGLIDTTSARRLLGHPDIDREMKLDNAAIEDAERVCEMLADEGAEFQPPEPLQDLDLCRRRATQEFLAARGAGAPESVLDRFRSWIEQAQLLLDQSTQPDPNAAQQQGAGPPQPSPQQQGGAQAAPVQQPSPALASTPTPVFATQ